MLTGSFIPQTVIAHLLLESSTLVQGSGKEDVATDHKDYRVEKHISDWENGKMVIYTSRLKNQMKGLDKNRGE